MLAWAEDLLTLASNFYWILGIFLFFTIFLHIMFVFVFPLSLKAWKLADYLWLILAFLSTLGLVGNARQFRAERHISEVEWTATQSLNDVRGWYSNYQILICDEVKTLKAKKINGSDYEKLCDWLESRINDINLLQKGDSPYPPLGMDLADGLAAYATIILPREQNILRSRLQKYADHQRRYEEISQERQRSSLQQMLLILAPMMFALALAIRFTKVTAEYRLIHRE